MSIDLESREYALESHEYYDEDRVLAKMPSELKPLARKLDLREMCLFYWVWGKIQRGLPLKKGLEKAEAQRIFGEANPKLMSPEALAEAKQRATPVLSYLSFFGAPAIFDIKDPVFAVLFTQQVDTAKAFFAKHWPKDASGAKAQERVEEGIEENKNLMPYLQGRGYVGTRSFFFPQEVYDRLRGKRANIADESLFPNRDRVDVNNAQRAFDQLIDLFKHSKDVEVRKPCKLLKNGTFVFDAHKHWGLSDLPLVMLTLAGYTRFEILGVPSGEVQIKDADTGTILAYAMPVRLK